MYDKILTKTRKREKMGSKKFYTISIRKVRGEYGG